MRKVVIVGLILAGAGVAAAAAGYWFAGRNTAEMVALPAGCHPPRGDLTPDGDKFVTLSDDGLEITVSLLNSTGNTRAIKLDRPARDLVSVDDGTLLVSHGESGQLILVSLNGERPEELIKLDGFAGEICNGSPEQVFITDPENGRVYWLDLAAKRVAGTFAVEGRPSRMNWRAPEKQLEVFDNNGKPLAVLEIGKKVSG